MVESLRITFLSSHPPEESSRGVAHIVAALGRRMVRAGHDVEVYFPVLDGELTRPSECEGMRGVPVPARPPVRLPYGPSLAYSWRAARTLSPDRDVLVAHNENGGTFVMDRVRRVRRGRVARGPVGVQTFHGVALRFLEESRRRRPRSLGPQIGYYPDRAAVRWLEGGAARTADACVACSRAVGGEVSGLYRVPSPRIRVIYNGVDPETDPTDAERAEARRSVGLAEGVASLSFIGEDTYRKGLDVAIAAVQRLRARGRSVVLLNIGNTAPSSDGVRSFGPVDAPTKRRLLLASDAFFLPTRYEGLPAVVQEAAALRIPVVTTAAANVEEGTPGRDYLRLEPNTAETAAELLDPLLGSAERRRAIGEAGYRAFGSRSYDAQTREYLALFSELLAGS